MGSRIVAASLLLCLGCSLLVDTSVLTECPSGFKLCGDKDCVRTDDPAFGCADMFHCEPCPLLHGIATCNEQGACAIKSCLEGFGCNNCETNIYTDELHCGDCVTQCRDDQLCSIGVCVPRASLQ